MSKIDYWKVLNELKVVSIVCVTSRPGSDFIQSLFDSHPSIISIDGDLDYEKFYMNSISIWGSNSSMSRKERIKKINLKDFFMEFAYKHLDKFKSHYDNLDLKQTENNIDINKFLEFGLELLQGIEFNKKNSFLAIYGAYNLARSGYIHNKKILLHHAHHVEKMEFLKKDFQNFQIIAANRDPRSAFISNMNAIKKQSNKEVTHSTYISIINRLFHGIGHLDKYKDHQIKINSLERLHENPKLVIDDFCNWLNIDFNEILLRSTWGGKDWYGDSLSENIELQFNENFRLQNEIKWKRELSLLDKILISYLMRKEIFKYSYNKLYTNHLYSIYVFVLILLPNNYELSQLKNILINFNLYKFIKWFFYIFKRYIIMYKKLGKVILKI